MSVHETALKQVRGDTAHDAADSGNPVKIGGKAATSAPAAVANGDRVNAYFDDVGRQAVFDGGTTISIDDGAGNISIDDGGNSITVDDGGTTVSVDDGGGALTVDGTVAVSTVGGTVVVAGDVNAICEGDVPHDAADSGGGGPVKIGGKALSSAPAAVANNDRVNAQFDTTGRLAVFPGHGEAMPVTDNAGSLTVDNASLDNAVDRQAPSASLSTIRAESGFTGRYNSSNVDGHSTDAVLYAKDDAGADVAINGASTAVTGSFLYSVFASTNTDVWYYIPMRNYRRLNFMVSNNLDRSVSVSIYGFLQRAGQTTQVQVKLLTTQSLSSPGYMTVSSLAVATGGDASHFAIPNLCEWDYVGIKCEVQASAPSTGDMQLLVSRDV